MRGVSLTKRPSVSQASEWSAALKLVFDQRLAR